MNELQAAQEKLHKLQNELAAQQKIVDDLKKGNEWPKDLESAVKYVVISSKGINTHQAIYSNTSLIQTDSLLAISSLYDVISAIENDLTWVERANKGERWGILYNRDKEKFEIYKITAESEYISIEFSLSTKEKAEHLIKYFSELLKQAMMI